MAFIGLGKINKNLIPLTLSSIFCFLNRLLNKYDGTDLFKNVILTNIFISCANLLIIIPYLIYKYRYKKPKLKTTIENIDNKNTQETKIEYIFEEVSDISYVNHKRIYVVVIALLFFANYYMFIYTIDLKCNTWIMYIIYFNNLLFSF